MIRQDGYWYVATPYTKFPAGIEAAFILACRVTARLAEKGIPVYSPIAHSHPIAMHGGLDAVDHDFWRTFDAPMVHNAAGIIVITAESWELSRGVAAEIEDFQKMGRPVVYWNPATEIPISSLQ